MIDDERPTCPLAIDTPRGRMWHVAGSLLEEAPRYTLTTGGPNDASVGEMMTLDEAQNVSMLDQIVTGDARALSAHIPDASVDLIFTDPVYQQIDDYRWLAETALRVLTPHGRVLTWCSKPKLGRCQLAMEDAGLEYVYTLDYTVQAKTFRMRWYNLFCWTTPCLWFQRPGEATKPRKWIPDTYIDSIILDDDEPVDVRAVLPDTFISTAGPSGSYIWNKNLGVLKAWLDVFSAPGETIYDPFTGSGSVPLVCRMLGRHFYASEIRSEVAQQASERIASMPEPMFLDEVA